MDLDLSSELEKSPQKSTFVNVLAWIFIIFGGFTTFISILQNIMIHKMFPKREMAQASQDPNIPAFAEFMFNHFDLFFLLILLISATSFISAIALLKRKNWARIVFIILMSAGIAWNVFALGLNFTMFNSMPVGEAPPQEFQDMMQIMQIAMVIMALGISTLFGFVIKKLCSTTIKEEFA